MSQWKRIGNFKIASVIFAVFLIGVLIGSGQSQKVSALSNNMYEDLKVFTDVIGLIQKDYVEETKSKDLVYGAVKGMLETLDPHSAFMPPNMYKEMQEETRGRFEGLGIEITVKDGILTVVSPIEGTPAYRAGVLAGDQIIKIDGEPTKNFTLVDSVKRMRGPRGTKVTITVMREGLTKPKDFTLVREVIPVRSVRYELLEKNYGYIRISQFQEKTDGEFEKTTKALEEESKGALKGLILDLRNNPGGLLDQAAQIADRFVDSGLIVSVEGRREDQNRKYYAHPDGNISRYPLVVLVNGGSASGAEIVAGAIQDHGRGILVGTQTFGKGSVQTIIPLKDGSGLRLTTARYYTPNGRSIQAKGIVPDIIVKLSRPEEEKEILPPNLPPKLPAEKDLERHLMDVEKGGPKEKEKPKKEEVKEKKPVDNQLERALELLKSWDIFKKIVEGKQK
ncbi:MAG: peptidase S41 [Deltaproteobacteria bacterium RBG_16_47_11]|nr:MAG: peptidase S41 [Deltaproteobacteria bacterium RBG_16_47_11]